MSDGDFIKRQVPSDQDRPGAPDIIEWLSQQEPQTRVYTSRYSTVTFYHACISRLSHTWKQIQRGSAWSKDDKIHLRETFGRFYLWGKGLPLDLLDDADDQFEETRNLVLELLCNISGLLSNVLDVLPEHVPNAKEVVILDEDTTITKELLTRANKDDRSPIAKIEKNTTIQSISSWLDEFDFYLDCLTDLVSTIGSAAWADELLPLDSAEAGDSSSKSANVKNHAMLESEHAQSHFVLQVRDKFPLSAEGLAQRLGKANWHRFMQLRREKPQVQQTDLQIKDSEFVRPALPALSKFYDSAIGSSLGRQSASDGSTLSHTSFASTAVEGETVHFRVPPTPAEATQGKPFSCSICGQVQSLKNRVAWKMHVFADLQAYTCTFEDCLGNQGPYLERSTWADHELREHFTKRAWTCRFCDRSETSADSYTKHLQNNHDFILGDKRLGKLLQDDRVTTLKSVKSHTCPLCLKDGWSSHRYYFAHVGRHMEEIALAVLPRDVDEEESNSDSSILETVSNSGRPLPPNTAGISLYHLQHLSQPQHLESYSLRHPQGEFADFGHHPSMLDSYENGGESSTRPRLTKDQVDVLESQFQAQPKPNSNVKRRLAVQTNLSLPRVTNWFQNRRAKVKQQRKQKEFEIKEGVIRMAEWKSEDGLPFKYAIPLDLNSAEISTNSDGIQMQMTPSSANTASGRDSVANAGWASLQRAMSAARAGQNQLAMEQEREQNFTSMPPPPIPPSDQAGATQTNSYADWSLSEVVEASPFSLNFSPYSNDMSQPQDSPEAPSMPAFAIPADVRPSTVRTPTVPTQPSVQPVDHGVFPHGSVDESALPLDNAAMIQEAKSRAAERVDLAKRVSLESFQNRKGPSNFISDADDDRGEIAYQRCRTETAGMCPPRVPNAAFFTNSPSAGEYIRARDALRKSIPTSADQKYPEIFIRDFPEQRQEHASAARQAAQQKVPKNYVFANATPSDF